MKSKKQRQSKRKFSRKRKYTCRYKKRGGISNPFLTSSNNSFANKQECSQMNVDGITDMQELHTRYQKCCPKTMFGFKNSSPICKKMEANFNQSWKKENDSHGHYGYDKTPTITP